MLYTLASGDNVAVAGVLGGICTAIVGIVMGTVRRTSETKQREQTKREVAAYIAEGAMTPEQGEKILNSGTTKKD